MRFISSSGRESRLRREVVDLEARVLGRGFFQRNLLLSLAWWTVVKGRVRCGISVEFEAGVPSMPSTREAKTIYRLCFDLLGYESAYLT
jgi:hypothetical protein